MAAIAQRAGQAAYAGLFVLLWPALLAWCAARLDASSPQLWPVPFGHGAGTALAALGAGLMAVSMWMLWRKGKGLPMNAYPPLYFVDSSTYAVFAHPIYLGFTLLVAGASVLADSRAGFWLITPLSALAAWALVLGYEGPELRRRFGVPQCAPWFALPRGATDRPGRRDRLRACVIAFGPWALAAWMFSRMPAPQYAADGLRMTWEVALPRHAWAVWVGSFAFAMAPAGVLLAPSSDRLRRFVRAAWTGSVLGFFVMLTLPASSPLPSPDGAAAPSWLVAATGALDADWFALPSFRAFWVMLSALALSALARPLALLAWALAAAIGTCSVLSGLQTVAGVAAGCATAVLCWHLDAVWNVLVGVGTRLSNSWAALRIGPVRIINHFVWSFLAATCGMLIAFGFSGPDTLGAGLVVALGGLLSAGAWGYWLEGGGRLSRPFGYYGFLFGLLGVLVALADLHVHGIGALAAGFAAGGPVTQAIGRLRCVVQGCCHGRPVSGAPGFEVTHPCSRVTALAGLHGVPVHPTQFYSIGGNAIAGLILWRLWALGASWSVIGGAYLVLTSLTRFVEEQYRGEPQTPKLRGLPVYQWLAIATFLTGIVAGTELAGEPAYPAYWLSWRSLGASVLIGLTTGILMSVDFPASQRRFSRLTVSK